MSDSILVRVTLDSYDMASDGRQTQVYVQIPEVARVSFLLPRERYEGLADRAWPEVLDVTNEYVTYGEVATNAASTASWMAVQGWLLDPANRDEMQAVFEEDMARRNPSAEVVRLRARVTELETQRTADHKTWQHDLRTARGEREAAAARIAELLAERHETNKALADVTVAQRAAEQPAEPWSPLFATPAALREDVTPQVRKLRALLAGQRAAVEDPHDSPLAHSYRVGRDLPEMGGAS